MVWVAGPQGQSGGAGWGYGDSQVVSLEALAAALREALPGHEVRVHATDAGTPLPAAPRAWDDLLVLLHEGPGDYAAARDAGRWLEGGEPARRVLPVALRTWESQPPAPVAALKSLVLDEPRTGTYERVVRRAAAMLGGPPDRHARRVFVSYRAVDGGPAARGLAATLQADGYEVYLDEPGGRTALTEGEDVQSQIHAWVTEADVVVVLDTPRAVDSPWVRREIAMAMGRLVPVLPLVCRLAGDHDRNSRIPELRDLRRYAEWRGYSPDTTPGPTELQDLREQLEILLSDVGRRRLRLPFVVQQAFDERRFAWNPRTPRRTPLYDVKREREYADDEHLVHCSLLGQFEPGAARAVLAEKEPRQLRAFYVFDGAALSAGVLREEVRRLGDADASTLVAVHVNELSRCLDALVAP